MNHVNRRRFIGASVLSGAALPASAAAVTEEHREITKILARYIVSVKSSDIPAPVKKEAARTFLNWLGCAIGGSREPAVENAIAALAPFAGSGSATILGAKKNSTP